MDKRFMTPFETLLAEIEDTSYHLGEATVLLRELVVKARAEGISWDSIGQRMVPPVSRQAAQQRFARYCGSDD